ncbi:MAG: hypothetical protein AB1778_04900 [Candidatus Bipolaricaulota bacterium]
MNAAEVFLGNGGYGALLGFLATSGLALVLSMPWVGRVGDYFLFPWRPSPLPFFVVLGFLAPLYAAQRAATIHWLPRRQRLHLLSLPLQVAGALFLSAPLVLTSAILAPGNSRRPLLALAVVLVGSAAVSIEAFAAARACFRRGLATAPAAWSVALAHALLPMVALVSPTARFLAALSPLGAALAALRGPTALELGFTLVPALLATITAVLVLQAVREEIHAPRS